MCEHDWIYDGMRSGNYIMFKCTKCIYLQPMPIFDGLAGALKELYQDVDLKIVFSSVYGKKVLK